MIRRSRIEYLVCGILSIEGDKCGYFTTVYVWFWG